jgi:LysM repeat protein
MVGLAVLGMTAAPAQAQSPTPIIVVITATPSPSPMPGTTLVAPASGAPACPYSVVVKPGDDLYRIALSANTSWPILAALNKIPNPNLIYVGETICLPGPAAVTTPAATASPAVTATLGATATGSSVLPTNTAAVVLPTNTVAAPVVVAPTVVFPTIALNTYLAGSGDTVVITGINFVASSTLDIYLAPYNPANPGVPSGNAVATTQAAGDGSLSVNFTIPSGTDGKALPGQFWTISVRSRANGYFGYTSYTNNK